MQRKCRQYEVDGLWPLNFCMKQLLLCLVLEVPYGPLGNAILGMGVHAAVAGEFMVGFTMENEHVVGKPAIVCMILLNLDP